MTDATVRDPEDELDRQLHAAFVHRAASVIDLEPRPNDARRRARRRAAKHRAVVLVSMAAVVGVLGGAVAMANRTSSLPTVHYEATTTVAPPTAPPRLDAQPARGLGYAPAPSDWAYFAGVDTS